MLGAYGLILCLLKNGKNAKRTTSQERRSRSGLILKRPAIGFVQGMYSQKIVSKALEKQWRNRYGSNGIHKRGKMP